MRSEFMEVVEEILAVYTILFLLSCSYFISQPGI